MSTVTEDQIKVAVTPGKSWLAPTKYTLLEDVQIGLYRVPKGFTSDGLSVPRVFWPLVSPAGAGFKAALVHDYALARGVKWKPALRLFQVALRVTKVGSLRRWLLVNAVRLYGLVASKE
jgi:hypothetical protein